jgi:hypothetical protein
VKVTVKLIGPLVYEAGFSEKTITLGGPATAGEVLARASAWLAGLEPPVASPAKKPVRKAKSAGGRLTSVSLHFPLNEQRFDFQFNR